MTDITKCAWIGCKKKKTCWRYVCPPDKDYQSWCTFDLKKNWECEYFYPITNTDYEIEKEI